MSVYLSVRSQADFDSTAEYFASLVYDPDDAPPPPQFDDDVIILVDDDTFQNAKQVRYFDDDAPVLRILPHELVEVLNGEEVDRLKDYIAAGQRDAWKLDRMLTLASGMPIELGHDLVQGGIWGLRLIGVVQTDARIDEIQAALRARAELRVQ